MKRKYADLTGMLFGRLTVIKETSERTRNGHRLIECVCRCGEIKKFPMQNLIGGETKSCGICSYSNNKFIEENGHVNGYTSKGEKFIFDLADLALVGKYTCLLIKKAI